MEKNIELEYRVEIKATDLKSILDRFTQNYALESHTRRVSFMSFSKGDNKIFDFRVRITNGQSEVVLKIGELHKNDRVEISQPISTDQFIGFARMLSYLTDQNFIGERETFNFKTSEGVTVSLVSAGVVAYIEYEMLSDADNLEANDKKLKTMIEQHDFHILDKAGFEQLNAKLDGTDWKFSDNEDDVERLSGLCKTAVA